MTGQKESDIFREVVIKKASKANLKLPGSQEEHWTKPAAAGVKK